MRRLKLAPLILLAVVGDEVAALTCNKYTNNASGGSHGDTTVHKEACSSSDEVCVTWTTVSSQAGNSNFDGTFGQCIYSGGGAGGGGGGGGCSLVREASEDAATAVTFCETCATDLCNAIITYQSNSSTDDTPTTAAASTADVSSALSLCGGGYYYYKISSVLVKTMATIVVAVSFGV